MREDELESLLRRAVAGNREAAGEVLQHFEGPLRASIQRLLGQELRRRVDAEDVYQSTVALALRDLDRVEFKGERALLGWLRTIAEHRIGEVARRHRAAKRDVRKERPLKAAGQPPSERTSPTQGAARGEVRGRLEAAVAALPDRERCVVELHTYEGLSFQEVAETMGLKGKSSARHLFQNALHKMGDLLEESGPALADGKLPT